jgi:putative transposase
MKASNFSDAQKAFIIKQGEEGTPVAEICRKAGISQSTYFNWKKKYAGLLPTEMKRLKQLEDENAQLKKIVADLTLDREMLQDVIRRTEGPRSERSEAWSFARTCSRDVQRLGSFDPGGLRGHDVRLLDVPLQVPPHGSGGRRQADQGNLRNARALRVSARARAAASGGLGDQHEEDPKDLQ